MTDSDLIRLYFARDERAISETRDRYGRYCMAIACDILGNEQDAEECVSDTYLKVWNSIPPDEPVSFKAYIATITRRLSINRYHSERAARRNRELEVALEELEACIPVPDEEAGELPALLNEFLGGLSSIERRLFVRRYWYAMMPAELAGKEGMTVNAVTVRLYKTRNKLRKFLEERGYHYERNHRI